MKAEEIVKKIARMSGEINEYLDGCTDSYLEEQWDYVISLIKQVQRDAYEDAARIADKEFKILQGGRGIWSHRFAAAILAIRSKAKELEC